MIRIAPQHQLISFVVERLRVPWRSEPAGVARPFIIAIAIDHRATRSQEAAVVEWPSSRNSVAHQRCLRCIECVAMSALCQKQTFRLLLVLLLVGKGAQVREASPVKLPRRQFLHLTAAAAVLPIASRVAGAETYPSRSITMLVGFPPGGPTDTLARILGEAMQRSLGQIVIVETVSGASGTIATGRVAHGSR